LVNDVLKGVYNYVVLLLGEKGIITLYEASLDGTKIKANTNCYMFVWGRSIIRSNERVRKQLDKSLV
jgi:hypothetical protein